MTEREPIINKVELTAKPQNTYSKGGDIFMEGGNRETGNIGRPDAPRGPIASSGEFQSDRMTLVPPERIARARADWAVFNKGRGPLSVNELRTQEMMTERGIPPMAGGEDGEPAPPLMDMDYEESLQYLFKNPYVLEQLRSETPDFSYKEISPGVVADTPKDRAMKDFEDFIKGLSIYRTTRGEDATIVRFGELLASTRPSIMGPVKIGDDERIDPATRKITSIPIMVEGFEISETTRRLLFEAVLEKIIGIPDEVPDDHYNEALGHDLETPSALGRLRSASRKGFSEDFSIYIAELISRRSMAHELNISFKFGEEYKKFIVSGLRPEGIDFIHNGIAGVALVVREYERCAADMLRERKEWFKQDAVVKIDEGVREVVENLHKAGLVKTMFKIGDGRTEERVLSKWEIERALRMGKIIFRGTQRMSVYAGMGQIPPDVDLLGRFGSAYDEYIVRDLVPEKILIARFSTNPGQIAVLKNVIKETKKDKYSSLFGLAEEAVIFADSGAPDPESHSWRMRLMFLANIKMAEPGGQATLERFLAEKAREYKGKGELDPIVGTGGLSDKGRENFCKDRDVRRAVLGQTLYLSILTRYGDFDKGLKADLWRKISTYNPSTIASLLAEEVISSGDEEVWRSLRSKLHVAEEVKNSHEARRYQGVLSTDDLENEMNEFTTGGDGYKYQIESYFSEENGNAIADPREAALLRKIIDTGYTNAEELAKAKMPFTFCITDVPKTLWDVNDEGTGGFQSADMIRLLSSDHGSISEAWGAIGKIVESPTHQEFAKNYAEAIDKYAQVHGRQDAQKKFEPFLVALLKMGSIDEKKAFMKSILQRAGIPTSEMEKYFEASKFSLGPTERSDILQEIAQLGAIADDKSSLENGMTQLQRMRKKTKSELVNRMLELARTLLMIFGPVFAIEFLKTIMPSLSGK